MRAERDEFLLSHLKDRQRRAVEMCVFDGLRPWEISLQMGTTTTAPRRILDQSGRKLAKVVELETALHGGTP